MTKTLEDLVSEMVNGTADRATAAITKLRGRIIFHLGEEFITISNGTFSVRTTTGYFAPKHSAFFTFQYRGFTFQLSEDNEGELCLRVGEAEILLKWWDIRDSFVAEDLLTSLYHYVKIQNEQNA